MASRPTFAHTTQAGTKPGGRTGLFPDLDVHSQRLSGGTSVARRAGTPIPASEETYDLLQSELAASLRPRTQAPPQHAADRLVRGHRAQRTTTPARILPQGRPRLSMWAGCPLHSIKATLEQQTRVRLRSGHGGNPAEEDGVRDIPRLATARSRRHQRDCSGGSRGVSSGTGGWPGAPCRNVIVA